jgi:magnesium-transporting ATPase (P-type)
LTGDKIETAINIGFSCDLLDLDMKLTVLEESTKKEIKKKLKEFKD